MWRRKRAEKCSIGWPRFWDPTKEVGRKDLVGVPRKRGLLRLTAILLSMLARAGEPARRCVCVNDRKLLWIGGIVFVNL